MCARTGGAKKVGALCFGFSGDLEAVWVKKQQILLKIGRELESLFGAFGYLDYMICSGQMAVRRPPAALQNAD